MDWMLQPLRKYADFTGRARRKEYWLFALGVWIVDVVLMALTGGFSGHGFLSNLVVGLFGLTVLVPSIAVGFRRLHDTNRSAWWLLIGLIPVIGAIVLLVFFVLDGTPGENRFGPDPKGEVLDPPVSIVS
jgi:uncharacterized membrane protein YhaH (DUF805 family)